MVSTMQMSASAKHMKQVYRLLWQVPAAGMSWADSLHSFIPSSARWTALLSRHRVRRKLRSARTPSEYTAKTIRHLRHVWVRPDCCVCLLYTSDAADE